MRIGGFDHPRIDLFVVLFLFCLLLGFGFGSIAGMRLFGIVGAVVGAILGLILGAFLGQIPDVLAYKSLFRNIAGRSDAQLQEMLTKGEWNFGHTLALLHLSARGHDVKSEFSRVVEMLESENQITRVFGFDAFRLVYTDKTKIIPEYDPRASLDACREQVSRLRSEMMRPAGGGPGSS